MGKKTLVILSAGIGSRFGRGIKQLEPIDDFGHIIIDYSIHDAIAAGFSSIIFIIRHDIERDFRDIIGERIEAICEKLGVEVKYAFQELSDVPVFPGQGKVRDRTKPWGTGHAVLACRELIDGPFAVINADDYYGRSGFQKASAFLSANPNGYALVGYQLKNTLSEHGGVTRGICSLVGNNLTGISETRNIVKTRSGAESNRVEIDPNSLVSMNFWCFPAGFLSVLEAGFPEFLANMNDPMKDEYLLPTIADRMINEGTAFSVLSSEEHWFGVTYQEDKPSVVESFRNLIDSGAYRPDLYSDL